METKNITLTGAPIGIGRIAEVFAWGDDRVLKLFRPEFPQEWADHEVEIGRAVCAAGVNAPAVEDVVEIDGRKGIVYERLDGPTMLRVIGEQPWMMLRAARQLAELHAQMHARTSGELPSQREKLRSALARVEPLSADVKARLLAHLDCLPDGDAICHGDFHPDNVLMTARGPVTIDWPTASRGNPLADVARTMILFLAGGLPPDMRGSLPVKVRVLLRMRRVLYEIYVRSYCKLRSVARKDIETWIPIQAATRLNEHIPGEATQLLAWIDDAFKRGVVA